MPAMVVSDNGETTVNRGECEAAVSSGVFAETVQDVYNGPGRPLRPPYLCTDPVPVRGSQFVAIVMYHGVTSYTETKMKLYDCTTAPSPRRVRVFAAEKGIELEKVEIDLAGGEQFGERYRGINPDCVVPALELDDGTRITEVVAICQYLEQAQPEPPLFGRTPLEWARSLEWNSKIEQQGLLAMMDTFRNSVQGLKGRALPGPVGYEQIAELAERGSQRVAAFFDRLERQLMDGEFVTGERYTIADISAMVFVDFAARAKIGIPEHAGNVRRWHSAVAARPSASA